MTEIVKQAMESLSVTCNRSALHPTDEDRIKSYLKALYKHGEDISPAIMNDLAVTYSWAENPTKQLLKWADAISSGRRVIIKNKMFVQSNEEIIGHLEKSLSE